MLNREDLTYWLGIVTFVLVRKLDHMEARLMATLSDVVAQDVQLEGEVHSLIDAFNAAKAGTLTAEQQAQVDSISASLSSLNTAIADAEAPVAEPAPEPAPAEVPVEAVADPTPEAPTP